MKTILLLILAISFFSNIASTAMGLTKGSDLFIASKNGNNEKIIEYLNVGSDIHRRDYYDRSPLSYALKSKQFETANLLLSKGATFKQDLDSTDSPLFYVISASEYKYLKTYIDAGADVNAKNKYGTTPLIAHCY